MRCSAYEAFALRLQSKRPVGRVAWVVDGYAFRPYTA